MRAGPAIGWWLFMLHGVLVVDKPANMTSAYVVEMVRRRAGVAKAGHTGTLDPIATGVLPIVIGHATKLAGYLIAEDKGYDAEFELGVETDTLDRTGRVVSEQRVRAAQLDDAAIAAALMARRGAQSQLPPMYSAIKQDGVRLYQRARAGQDVQRCLRPIVVHSLELRWRRGCRVAISVHCSKGTFIRSLVSDVGKELGVGAHLTELRRSKSGIFTLAHALPLDGLTPAAAAEHLIPMTGLLAVPSIVVPQARHAELRDGRPEVLSEYARSLSGVGQLIDEAGQLLALVEQRPEGLRYLRVFPEGFLHAPA
jgi:tRNA pseudouridine55 synthase